MRLNRAIVKLVMPKKRKTKQEKIILRLKRELKTKASQEAISKRDQKKTPSNKPTKKTDTTDLSSDIQFVKKDLIKSLVLALIVLSLEVVLYLKPR